MPYDPQRSRSRPDPADEGPAPVDALLGGGGDADTGSSDPAPRPVASEVTSQLADTSAAPDGSATPEQSLAADTASAATSTGAEAPTTGPAGDDQASPIEPEPEPISPAQAKAAVEGVAATAEDIESIERLAGTDAVTPEQSLAGGGAAADDEPGEPGDEPPAAGGAREAAADDDEAKPAPLPDGVAIDVTAGGEVVVHTTDADVEITPAGDDVIVRTDDATVEIRAETDEVLVSTGVEDVYVDTTPRGDAALEAVLDAEAVQAEGARRLQLAVAAVIAAVLAALVAAALRRRHDEA
jgi:hypothetical protein